MDGRSEAAAATTAVLPLYTQQRTNVSGFDRIIRQEAVFSVRNLDRYGSCPNGRVIPRYTKEVEAARPLLDTARGANCPRAAALSARCSDPQPTRYHARRGRSVFVLERVRAYCAEKQGDAPPISFDVVYICLTGLAIFSRSRMNVFASSAAFLRIGRSVVHGSMRTFAPLGVT